MGNCFFYLITVVIFVMSLVGMNYIDNENQYFIEDFKYTCPQLALVEDIPQDSFIQEVNYIYHNASALLCSSTCPCGLRGDGLGSRMLSEFDSEDYEDHSTINYFSR